MQIAARIRRLDSGRGRAARHLGSDEVMGGSVASESSDDDGSRDTHATPTSGVSQVSPSLYLGTFMSEQNRDVLLATQISHILQGLGPEKNVAVQIGSELQPSHADAFEYLSVCCNDNHQEDFLHILRPCLRFVDDAVTSGNKVLVHCMAGVSRSPALCCAYLMWKQRLGFTEALAHVTAAHPMAHPNPVFQEQLRAFETEMQADINKLPNTDLAAILNKSFTSDDLRVGGLHLDDDSDADLDHNLTEDDWL